MKLYTYQKDNDGVDRIGVGCTGWPGLLWPVEAFGLSFADMNDLIRRVTPAQLSRMADAAGQRAAARADTASGAGCTVPGHQLRGPRGRIGAVP